MGEDSQISITDQRIQPMERPLGFVPDVDTFSFHIHQNDELIQNGDSNTNSAPELLFGNDCEFGADGSWALLVKENDDMVICDGPMNGKAKSKYSCTEPPEVKENQRGRKEELPKNIFSSQMKSHSPEQHTNPQKHARNEDGVTSSDGKGAARPLKRRVRFKPGLVEGQTINSGLGKNDGNDKKRWDTVSTQPKSILKKEVPCSGNRKMPTNGSTAAYTTRPNALDLLLLCTQAVSKFETHWNNLQNLSVSAKSILKHS